MIGLDQDAASPTMTKLDIERTSESDQNSPLMGRDNLYDSLPPHESYEGLHRYDPAAKWTADEEAAVVRKTDMYLLSWICLMVTLNSNLASFISRLNDSSSLVCSSIVAIYRTL